MNAYPPQTTGIRGKCNDCCPEGHGCALRADMPHVLHICSNPQCKCHSKARYQPGATPEPEVKHTQTHRPVMAKAR
jgi:hypothetical protein